MPHSGPAGLIPLVRTLVAALALTGAAATPALAQNFFERLLRPLNPQPEAAPAPVAPAPTATPPAAAPAAVPTWPDRLAILPPKRPAVAPAALTAAPLASGLQPTAAQPAAPAAAAPASSAQAPAAKPAVTAAITPPAPFKPQEPLTQAQIVEKANAYFNTMGTLVADFTQIGGDGRRLGGTLYLQRPGRIRFDYDAPSTLLVVADGQSVAVRDRRLSTQDIYAIGQTPLKFLLRERVSLGQDVSITGIASEGEGVRIQLEDRSTFGGTSKITLFFDPRVETLQQWRIIDPQGFQTTVMLNKTDRTRRVDAALFAIDYSTAYRKND
jgi:outer membrane lipoprotein-sorting protein